MTHILFFYVKKMHVFFYIALKFLNPWKKINGIFLPLRLSIGFNTNRWIVSGSYEYEEWRIVKDNLRVDDVVLEIGTGLGYLSTFISKRIGSDRLYTFEANPKNYNLAKEVFRKNNVNPRIENVYLSNDNKLTLQDFPINKNNALGSSVFVKTLDFVPVNSLNLNAFIKKFRPTFLVLDIEGGEYDLFKDIDFFSICKIQVELHPYLLGKEKIDEIWGILNNEGFILKYDAGDDRNFYFEKNTH